MGNRMYWEIRRILHME